MVQTVIASQLACRIAERGLGCFLPGGDTRKKSKAANDDLHMTALYRAVLRGDVDEVKTTLPSLLTTLARKPLLYVPLDVGGHDDASGRSTPVTLPVPSAARPDTSGPLNVVLPEVDVDRVARRGLWSPQFARREADRVDVLRTADAATGRIGVLQRPHTMIVGDDATLAAHVAGEARVPLGVDVASAHGLRRAVFRPHRQVESRRPGNGTFHWRWRRRNDGTRQARIHAPGGQFLFGDEAAALQEEARQDV